MKRYIACLSALAIAFCCLQTANAAIISSTFDTDLDGWTADGGFVTYSAAGGNPGGHLIATDDESTVMGVVGPAKFSGDLSSFNGGVISFDAIRIKPTGATQTQFGTVFITDGITTASRDLAPGDLPESWTNFSASLNAAGWGLGEAAWTTLLSSVTSITVILESTFGVGEEVGFDNFILDDEGPIIPEPSSLLLLMFGIVGVVGYRWVQRTNPQTA